MYLIHQCPPFQFPPTRVTQSTRLCLIAVHFFLGIEQRMADDEEEDGDAARRAHKMEVNTHSHSRKTKGARAGGLYGVACCVLLCCMVDGSRPLVCVCVLRFIQVYPPP